LYAAKLAGAGKSVVVLECGPPWEMSDLLSSQIWARRIKWGGPNVDFAGDHHSFPHNLNTGWGFGGAALHHYATWPRMPEAAFQLKSRFGRGIDWPFGYDELRPWYDRVQEEVGVSGDAAAEPWRPAGAPYPMPGVEDVRRRAGAEARVRGARPAVAPLPAAITTVEYKGRPPCQYDGWCDAGCPIGSLANPLATYFPAARRPGARIEPHATVLRIVPAAGPGGGRRICGQGGQRSRAGGRCRHPRRLRRAEPAHPAELGRRRLAQGRRQ
jgi:choline dehydrogenase-like flavoprotein